MVVSVIVRDRETYKKFKQITLGQGKSVTEVLWAYIEHTVSKYDDGKITLDKFTDPNYVPRPDLYSEFDKMFRHMLTLNKDKLDEARAWHYKNMLTAEYLQNMSLLERMEMIRNNTIIRFEYIWKHASKV